MSATSLQPGDRIRCPHCGAIHEAQHSNAPPSTAYAAQMLYILCGSDRYYIGQQGFPSLRFEIQEPMEAH